MSERHRTVERLPKNPNDHIQLETGSNGRGVAGDIARDAISIAELRSFLNGRVIEPGDAGYDQARAVFYGGIDRRPALIVQPIDADEVARVVSLAREAGLELAIRSGGHSSRSQPH